ncbi:MAG: hypothetical protein JWL86_5998 [Rhizobium sp.]|nr:hypothetical protein [Rhizobium sp.]
MHEATITSESVRKAFLTQEKGCYSLGSPFTARLSRLHADRLQRGNAVADRILGWQGDPSPAADSVPLRIAGCLHALVLGGWAPELSTVYPPNEVDDDALWQAVSRAHIDHTDFILERLKSAPQTNEVRRSAALLPGFLTLGKLFGKPLVISEVGASAGLNLQWDRYRYRLGDVVWGDASAGVTLEPDWTGPSPPDVEVTVQDRAGCDLNPVDATNPEHRLRMLSYIWADQPDRLTRTRNALDLAARPDLRVEWSDAIDWLGRHLATPFPGAIHVVYHSIAWQYFPKTLQQEGERLIAEAGTRATPAAPFARLAMEADGGSDASLTLQVWPSGEKQEIGRADFHGRSVIWKGWT